MFALDTAPFQANFRQGLRELGYEEGRNSGWNGALRRVNPNSLHSTPTSWYGSVSR